MAGAGGDGPSFEVGSFPPLISAPLSRAAMSSALSSASAGLAPSVPVAAGHSVLPHDYLRASSPIFVQDLLAVERQKYAHLVAFLEHRGFALPSALVAGDLSMGLAADAVAPAPLSLPLAPTGVATSGPLVGPRVDQVLEVGPDSQLQPASSAAFGQQLGPGPQAFSVSGCAPILASSDTLLTLEPSPATTAPASVVAFELSNSPALGPASSLLPPVQSPVLAPVQASVQQQNVIFPTWSRVVQGRVSSATASDSSLRFFPPASTEGDVIIKPPQDVLRRGNSIWATSLIGGFLHSRLPFKLVESFAFKAWGGLGLQKVFLHAKGYFIFKFSSASDRENVLALGPWYVSNKLLLLQHWKEGADLLTAAVSKVPIWVKLHQVPYAYWTSEGLSYLASGIGTPLFLDNLTAKLEPLPYARVCIEISAGAPLPAKLLATNLDVETGEETLIEVKVEYQSKPRSCGVCSSFGHSQFKCPRANFQWVPRSSAPPSTGLSKEALQQASQALPKPFQNGDLPKAIPTGDFPKASGDSPKVTPKGSSQQAFPKAGSQSPLMGCPSEASSRGILPIPNACDRELPEGPPEGYYPTACSPMPSQAGSCPISGSRFSVLADDPEEAERAAVPSDDEPPSWGPLVRRLKAIDEKEGRALLSADVGPPLRVQPKHRKKKSPKGK